MHADSTVKVKIKQLRAPRNEALAAAISVLQAAVRHLSHLSPRVQIHIIPCQFSDIVSTLKTFPASSLKQSD